MSEPEAVAKKGDESKYGHYTGGDGVFRYVDLISVCSCIDIWQAQPLGRAAADKRLHKKNSDMILAETLMTNSWKHGTMFHPCLDPQIIDRKIKSET